MTCQHQHLTLKFTFKNRNSAPGLIFFFFPKALYDPLRLHLLPHLVF